MCPTALVSFKPHLLMCDPKDVTVQYMPLFVMYVGVTTMDKPVLVPRLDGAILFNVCSC